MRAIITIIVFALAGCGPSLQSQAKTRIEEFHRDFPVGMSLSEAEKRVQRRSLPYTLLEQRKCEEDAKSRILRIDQRVARAFLRSIAWVPPGTGSRLQFNCGYCSMHLGRWPNGNFGRSIHSYDVPS